MIYPNFFLLGAGKSGTTTLYACLKKHPDIFLSEEKEPNFYNTHFNIVKSTVEYQALFSGVKSELIVGEASHAYLSDPNCAERIRNHHPNARFLVILRNPAQRAYSLYNHMRRHGYETLPSFEHALALEESRFHSASFISNCDENIWNFAYFKSGLYAEQIERYFSFFQKKQFHFLTLNELANNPRRAVSDIINFLGLNSNENLNILKKNDDGYIPHSLSLRKTVRKLTKFRSKSLLARGINKINNTKSPPPLNHQTYKELMHKYKDDLNKLYLLTGVHFLDIGIE